MRHKQYNHFFSFPINLIIIYEHLHARPMFGVPGLKEIFTIYVNESHESHLMFTAPLWGKRADDDLILPMSKQRARKVQDDPKRTHSIQQCVKTWI